MFAELLPHHLPLEEITRRQPRGLILSGGPASVYAPEAPKLREELLGLGIPVLGICYGMQAMVLELGGRVEGAEVGEFGRSRLMVSAAGRLLAGTPGRAELLDEPPRHGLRGAARVHGAGVVDGVARRGDRERRAGAVRDPVPPRGRAHALRDAHPRDVPARHLRVRHGVVRRVGHRGADRADPRAGGRREGDLRAVRRGGLVGGRAADLPGGRRPADLRVRRPRPDAQERGQPGGRRVQGPVQGAADRGGRRGALPRAAGRGHRP